MESPPRRTKPRLDGDGGVRIVEHDHTRKSSWLLLTAIGLVGVAVFLAVELLIGAETDEAPLAHQSLALATPPAAARVERSPARPAVRLAAREPAARVPEVSAPPPREEERAPDEPSGIALFPPPGTDPVKRGILVPEDFELPEGFVRHYQATDEGGRVPAILMFHPDYEWVDEGGEVLPLPKDLIVPPDMAPPGMPIEMLELPEDEPGGEPAP